MHELNVTTCEKKFNNAILDCSKATLSSLVGLVWRQTTVQYNGRRSNGFLSTLFFKCRAVDRRVNFFRF
jgi:hypothetical protein